MTYYSQSGMRMIMVLIVFGALALTPILTRGMPDDPPTILITKSAVPASDDCQYKYLENCDPGDIEQTKLVLTYMPGTPNLVEGGGIKIRFSNVLNGKAYLVEDRKWPAPNLLDGNLSEYTTAYIVHNGDQYPCTVKDVGECDDNDEDCDNLPCCIYFCNNAQCLENKGKKTSCDFIKIVTHNQLSFQRHSHIKDRIVITYGDDSISTNGLFRVPNMPMTQSIIVAERNGPSGQGHLFLPVHRTFPAFEYPTITVTGLVSDGQVNEEVTNFDIIAPTTPASGVVTVTVKALMANTDASRPESMKNAYLVENFQGKIRFSGSDPGAVYPSDYTFTPQDGGMKDFDVYFGENPDGVHTVSVCMVDTGTDQCTDVTGISNPINFENTGDPIYWGVLQSHSMQGGHANHTPEFCYEFAKDISKLDFYAISEHCNTKYFDWNYTKNVCEAAYEPGVFVTFPAFEWSSKQWGHRHVIFKDGDNAMDTIPCEEKRNPSVYLADSLVTFLSDLHDTGAPDNFIIPHHVSRDLNVTDINWDYVWGGASTTDPVTGRQTMVEMFSTHGTSEHYILPTPGDPNEQAENYIIENNSIRQLDSDKHGFVRWALQNDYRFGVISGSDNHSGMSGSLFGGTTLGTNTTFYSRNGLTAVRTASLSRDGIWNAMKAKKTYGTTGARIYLDFKMNDGTNDHDMGETFDLPAQQDPVVKIDTIGTVDISDVWVVKIAINGQIEELRVPEHVIQYNGLRAQGSMPDLNVAGGETYCYYIKVKQDDGELAWSSPIWMYALE